MADDDRRPLRADARKNRERVLAAARSAFAESGFAVPLDVIAALAGVGAGTVYRHFPTKEALFQAVVAARVDDLIAAARELASGPDPGSAFFDFLDRLSADASSKRDLPDAIDIPGPLRDDLEKAVRDLLTGAQQAGAVRDDVTAADILTIFKRLLAFDRQDLDAQQQRRLQAIIVQGLRASDTPRHR